jgi:hypothetical protein
VSRLPVFVNEWFGASQIIDLKKSTKVSLKAVYYQSWSSAMSHTLREPPAHSLRSSIWVNRTGQWQIVFHQGTIAAAYQRARE